MPPALLSDRHAFPVLVVMLAVIAAVYLGFALLDGRPTVVAIEALAVAAFAVVAVTASSATDARWLAGGLLAHAGWDAIHHRRGIDTVIPPWYVPFCIGFDVVVGFYVLARF